MRAKLESLDRLQSDKSFICYEIQKPRFDLFWHFHPEYELTYIKKGRGKRLVGDSIESFREGDLVLIGPQIPHVWVSDEKRKQQCEAIVIQFPIKLLEPLERMPEFSLIRSMLKKSESGLVFQGLEKQLIDAGLKEMISTDGIGMFLKLISLLDSLSKLKNRPLSSVNYVLSKINTDTRRINKILVYVQDHYKLNIQVSKAASIVHLSKSAFCKYFKRAMGKTFSDYVNDIRIAQACQLLIETDRPISDIAFNSGFESLAYFNRVFLKKKKMSPREYRKI